MTDGPEKPRNPTLASAGLHLVRCAAELAFAAASRTTAPPIVAIAAAAAVAAATWTTFAIPAFAVDAIMGIAPTDLERALAIATTAGTATLALALYSRSMFLTRWAVPATTILAGAALLHLGRTGMLLSLATSAEADPSGRRIDLVFVPDLRTAAMAAIGTLIVPAMLAALHLETRDMRRAMAEGRAVRIARTEGGGSPPQDASNG